LYQQHNNTTRRRIDTMNTTAHTPASAPTQLTRERLAGLIATFEAIVADGHAKIAAARLNPDARRRRNDVRALRNAIKHVEAALPGVRLELAKLPHTTG
jgi:hypothetical protein